MAHPKGGYRNKKGERIPGTTTIIGRFKESGGLLHWAYQQGMAAERGEINNLYDKRDEAADSGTLAHAMVEAHINGNDPSKVPEFEGASQEVIDQAWKAFGAYKLWESMTKLEIVDQEMQLVSEDFQFGGCPDAIGIIGGELCLIDWKTSNGVYPDYLLQLAAYKLLWEENNPDRPLTGGFHLCRFSKTHGDFAHHHYPELDEALEAFKLMRPLYDLMKKMKKRV
jgi:hypothetical protein